RRARARRVPARRVPAPRVPALLGPQRAGPLSSRAMRCLALLCVAAGVVPAVAAQEPAPSGDLVPFLGAWCTECHGSEDPEGDLDLSALGRDPDDDPLPALLLVQDVLRAREMPPDDAPRPADEDYAAALATVERLLRL